MKRILVTIGVAVVCALGPAAPVIADEPTYTCRASVIRIEKVPLLGTIEPIVANRQHSPCRAEVAP